MPGSDAAQCEPQLSELYSRFAILLDGVPDTPWSGKANTPSAGHQGPESAVSAHHQGMAATVRATCRNTAQWNEELRRVLQRNGGTVTMSDGNLARILVPKDEADRWGQLVDSPVIPPDQVGCSRCQLTGRMFLENVGQGEPVRVEYNESGDPKNLWIPFWYGADEAKRLSTGDLDTLRLNVARHRRLHADCHTAAPAPEAEAEAAEGPEKQKTCRDILNDHFSKAEWDDLMSDGEPDRNMSGTAESAPPAPNKKETATFFA